MGEDVCSSGVFSQRMDLKQPGWSCVPLSPDHPHMQGSHQWTFCHFSNFWKQNQHFLWSHSTGDKVFPTFQVLVVDDDHKWLPPESTPHHQLLCHLLLKQGRPPTKDQSRICLELRKSGLLTRTREIKKARVSYKLIEFTSLNELFQAGGHQSFSVEPHTISHLTCSRLQRKSISIVTAKYVYPSAPAAAKWQFWLARMVEGILFDCGLFQK